MSARQSHRSRSDADEKIRFLTIADVAERLQVSNRSVRRWVETGALAVHRMGRLVRVAEADLRAFLAIRRGA